MLGATATDFDAVSTEPPETMNGILRPYQERGYGWLHRMTQANLGVCLADDMGLGKTIQSLANILRHVEGGANDPTLVVCPTSVIQTWLAEAERWTPALRVTAHHGPGRPADVKEMQRVAQANDVIVTSYATAVRDAALLGRIQWHGIYADEAQNIKNHRSRRSQVCRLLPATYRVAVTGTPVENNITDLWAILDFVNPGMPGPDRDFEKLHASPNGRRLTQPFILRRLKTDPALEIDLPDIVRNDVSCPLTTEQASLYAAVLNDLDEALRHSADNARHRSIFSAITSLKQICNHPAHFLSDGDSDASRSGKMTRLLQILEETFAAGDKSVVFTDFVEMARIIQEQIATHTDDSPLIFHGGLNVHERTSTVRQFQNQPSPRTLIVSVRAGGTGIDLTAGNHAVHYDRWWNPAVENQANDRLNRPGQRKMVQIHNMTFPGTLEEHIAKIIANKQELFTNAVTTGDGWLRDLSAQQVRDALNLTAHTLSDE